MSTVRIEWARDQISDDPDLCWSLESEIEELEHDGSADEVIVTVNPDDLVKLSVEERVHLQMFLDARRRPDICGHSYIGSPNPTLILVGDEHNGGVDRVGYRAAFGPWHGCGPYLLRTIDGVEDETIGICNVNEPPDISWLKGELKPEQIVALGNRAADRLFQIGVPCRKVPHPQWWKRFKYNAMDEYRARILDR